MGQMFPIERTDCETLISYISFAEVIEHPIVQAKIAELVEAEADRMHGKVFRAELEGYRRAMSEIAKVAGDGWLDAGLAIKGQTTPTIDPESK